MITAVGYCCCTHHTQRLAIALAQGETTPNHNDALSFSFPIMYISSELSTVVHRCREKADSRICTFGQNWADHTRHVCSICCIYWYSLLVCMSLGYATMEKDIWPYLHCNCTKIKANRSICVVTAVCLDLVCRYCGLPWFWYSWVQIWPNVLRHCSITKRHTDKQTIPVDAADVADMPGMVSSILTKGADTAVCLFTAA